MLHGRCEQAASIARTRQRESYLADSEFISAQPDAPAQFVVTIAADVLAAADHAYLRLCQTSVRPGTVLVIGDHEVPAPQTAWTGRVAVPMAALRVQQRHRTAEPRRRAAGVVGRDRVGARSGG
ncbi:MAG: hypothetical protein PF961_13410 [Planctomycetota bacterium]|nr:hypothetical protein [Planctomycetota bacterium]